MERNFTIALGATIALVLAPAMGHAQDADDADDMTWVPGVATDGTIQWGAAREANVQQPSVERRAVPNIFQVISVEMRGSYVVLEDGTRWEVFLPHRPGSATWRAGDHVLIQPLPVRRGAHTHRLQNGERDDVVAVRFAGMVGGDVQPSTPPAPPRP